MQQPLFNNMRNQKKLILIFSLFLFFIWGYNRFYFQLTKVSQFVVDEYYDRMIIEDHLIFLYGASGVKIIDINDLQNPLTVTYPLDDIEEMILVDSYLYLFATENQELYKRYIEILDISAIPESIELINSYPVHSAGFDIIKKDQFIYLSSKGKLWDIIDIAVPNKPSFLNKRMSESMGSMKVTINGHIYSSLQETANFYATRSLSWIITDISDPINPKIVSKIELTYPTGSKAAIWDGKVTFIPLNGQYLLIGIDGIFDLYDIGLPTQPKLQKKEIFNINSSLEDFAVYENKIFLISGGELYLLIFKNNDQIEKKKYLSIGHDYSFQNVKVDSCYIYITYVSDKSDQSNGMMLFANSFNSNNEC